MAKKKDIENSEEEAFAEEPVLTEKETWDIIEFSRAMGGLYGRGMISPELVSARMKDITFNPLQADEDMLEEAMLAPKENEKNLQQFSQSFEMTSMVYKRLISYLGNMLSFDITYTSNAGEKDYTTPKYRKDITSVERFLDRFEYRKEFRTVVKQMLRNDAYFGCLRDVGDKIILQELPAEYCKITGRWGNGFLFSFNMYWFLQPGVDIDMYSPFFKKAFKKMMSTNKRHKDYDPSMPPETRISSWMYWVDVPVSVGVCFKLTPELATRLPYFSPLFNDLILQPLMRNLQKSTKMAAANKIIMGEVPYLNKEAKATVRDTIAISPDLLGKFMALVKTALSDAVKIASAPLQNIKGISFDSDNEIYDSYLRTALASSGINTNLIFSSDIKPNSIETQLSLNVDEQMMMALYEQFDDAMEYWVKKYIKTFKFRFTLEGTEFSVNRKERLDTAMSLFEVGILLPQKIAAAVGMKPSDFRKHMEESNALDFIGKLQNPSFIQQEKLAKEQAKVPKEISENKEKPDDGTNKTKGRPKKADSELGDEGDATRAQGTNVGRGGEI